MVNLLIVTIKNDVAKNRSCPEVDVKFDPISLMYPLCTVGREPLHYNQLPWNSLDKGEEADSIIGLV